MHACAQCVRAQWWPAIVFRSWAAWKRFGLPLPRPETKEKLHSAANADYSSGLYKSTSLPLPAKGHFIVHYLGPSLSYALLRNDQVRVRLTLHVGVRDCACVHRIASVLSPCSRRAMILYVPAARAGYYAAFSAAGSKRPRHSGANGRGRHDREAERARRHRRGRSDRWIRHGTLSRSRIQSGCRPSSRGIRV